MVDYFLDLKGHCLAGPHVVYFAEPAICLGTMLVLLLLYIVCLDVPLMVGWVISETIGASVGCV